MKYQKQIILKDGEICLLRNAQETDAQQILDQIRQTSGETQFLARYPDEIRMSLLQEQEFLNRVEEDKRSIIITAFLGDNLVGNIGMTPINPLERYRHRAEIGLSVKKDYWGRGIGSALVISAMEAALAAGYEQVELEVMAGNSTAESLYQKFGFQTYGIRPDSFLFRDGRREDAHLMMKKLKEI